MKEISKKTNLAKHEYRIDRTLAQGDITYDKNKKVRFINGERVETLVQSLSPQQEKINDVVTMCFQKQTNHLFNYMQLREEALEELNDLFIKHELNRKDLSYEKKRLKAAAIQQIIDNKILNRFTEDPIMEITFDELIEISKLRKKETFKKHVNNIIRVVGRGKKTFKRDIIDIDSMKIKNTKFSNMVEIIGVDFILNEAMGAHFDTIFDYLEATIDPLTGKAFRNKKKHVEKVVFRFSKEILPYLISQSSDYVLLKLNTRMNFKLQGTFSIDSYITSIQNAQEFRHLTDFTPENLQKKFGYNFSRFDRFLSDFLDPCIKDFNNCDPRNVSYLIRKQGVWGDKTSTRGGKLEMFRWVITNYEKTARDGVSSEAYYVALRILSTDSELKNKFDTVGAMAESIDEQLEGKLYGLTMIANKSIDDWKKEAEKEIQCEEAVVKMLTFANCPDIVYDKESMSIMSSVLDLDNIDTPCKSLQYLKEELKIAEPLTVNPKKPFPYNDYNFVLNVLNAAKEKGIKSPLDFYLKFSYYHTSKGIKQSDWNSAVNAWLTNDRYIDISTPLKLRITINDEDIVGIWNDELNELETDEAILPIDLSQLSKLINTQRIKAYGTL